MSRLSAVLSQSGSFLSDLFILPLNVFFFLLYRDFFIQFIHKAFPRKSNRFLNLVIERIFRVLQNYLLGLFIVMSIVGGLNSLGLLLLGIENPFFFGFLGALLLLIPYIGILIGALFPAMVALVTKDSAWYAAGVIGVFVFVQLLEGNFIMPKITGSKININGFISITSLVLFAMLWGTTGMILALPVTASIKIIFDHTPSLKPYGFLLSEPLEKHLKRPSVYRLHQLKRFRKSNC